MCKTDRKMKFFHTWQAWQKVMSRGLTDLAFDSADHVAL